MLESIDNQYTKIGYVAQSHGVQGEVLIIPELYAPALFNTLRLVRIANNRGDLVPARVESVRVQEKNERLSFFVKFEHITDRSQSEQLKNRSVYAENEQLKNLPSADEPLIDFSSYEVWENEHLVGFVEQVIENPAHLILRVITEEGRELLVPLAERYVTEVNEDANKIFCKNLESLKDL